MLLRQTEEWEEQTFSQPENRFVSLLSGLPTESYIGLFVH